MEPRFAQLLVVATVVRLAFFAFGLYQDAHMAVKYTDIDYLVFSDAADYVVSGASPYARETYRYTPLLAWLMVPNHWFYSWGKLFFVACDLVTGALIYATSHNVYSSAVWLLNPMVITISTRGSAESVLTVLVMAFVYCLVRQRSVAAALWLGFAVHFKIYPVIYLPTAVLYLSRSSNPVRWFNARALAFAALVVAVVVGFAAAMFRVYGHVFLYETYWYHLERLDHRHNFSVWNLLLYYKSAADTVGGAFSAESVAFVPQLVLSGVVIPLVFWSRLQTCLFLQTFTFVTFNKVMTSQYFIWFLIFLPGLLQETPIGWAKGGAMVVAWVATQGAWLSQAYNLEFLGQSTFDTTLFYSAIAFFLTNCWIVCEVMRAVPEETAKKRV
ncbi:GPI mannosyltransferase 1 [Diutina catenulata]